MHRMKNTLIVAAVCIAIATCPLQAKTKAPAAPQKDIVRASNDFAVRICRQPAGEKGNFFLAGINVQLFIRFRVSSASLQAICPWSPAP